MITILEQGIIQTVPGLEQDARALLVSKMEKYIKEIILFNSAYNLTNTSDHDELAVRHILDSLAGYKVISDCLKGMTFENGMPLIGDIGSGGGLPGIPLAAAFLCGARDGVAGLQFKLVERMEKRCSFLENCKGLLGLTNTEIWNTVAEQVEEGCFDLITFRAFRPLDQKMTKTLLRMVRPGGVICAYKAKMENIKEEMEGIKNLVGSWEVLPLSVPGLEDSERNMVVIRK